MRDPIGRTWSQMRMMARRRGLSLDREEVALRLAGEPLVVARSEYLRTLENWGRHFSPDRILVGFMEQVRADPRALLTRVFEFLGVAGDDSAVAPELLQVVHEGVPKPMPLAVERALAKAHIEELRILEMRFGSPVSAWRERAERVLEG